MARLLVIHDDAPTRQSLIRLLSGAGHVVRSVPTPSDAEQDLAMDPPDVVLVGLDAADPQSVEVLNQVRTVCSAPLIVAAPGRHERGSTRLLRAGADGVVARPFAPAMLLARIAALVRRCARPAGDDAIVLGRLRVEPRRRVAAVDGRRLVLTPREFELLAYLARRPREVISRQRILAEVWRHAYVDPQTVNVHLSCLRRKLGESAARPHYLWTVRGVGVRLEVPEEGDGLGVGA